MKLEIELELPDKKLSPNTKPGSHGSRMAQMREVKKYRTAAKLAFMVKFSSGFKPRWKTATVAIQWCHRTHMRPDRDNAVAWLKSGFDGLADAGLFDNDRGVTYLPVEFQRDPARPRIVLTITGPT